MKQILIAAVYLVMLSAAGYAQDRPACPTPGDVVFPLGEVIEKAGLSLEFDFTDTSYPDYGTPEHVAQIRRHVLANLKGKSQTERDALLLGRLSWSTKGALPLLGITTFPDAGQFDDYMDLLNRRGLTEYALALHLTKSAFPIWDTSAQKRYEQWSDGQGGILNPLLDRVLRDQSAAFRAAEPPLLKAAEDILKDDPSFDSFLAQRGGVSDEQKHSYLMAEISACIARYGTPAEADTALAELDPILADFHVVDMFLLEALNGGMHQYLFNSTGMLAPRLVDVIDSWTLPEQASSVRDAMGYFPAPYPRDTQARREVMRGFDPETDDALNEGTWISDDPAIWEAVKTRAIEAGYWPQ